MQDGIELLMEEIGALAAPEDGRDGDPAWRLAIDEIEFEVRLGSARRMLTLSAPLSSPPEARRYDVCKLALLYNQTWDATGGAQIDWRDGQFRLHQDVCTEGLPLERLAGELAAFSDKRSGWCYLLERMPEVQPTKESMLDVLASPGAIRS